MKKLSGSTVVRRNVAGVWSCRLLLMVSAMAPALCGKLCAAPASDTNRAPAGPDFNQAIRPILSENCYKCHGPDDAVRKGNLRFDVRAEALRPAKSGKIAIVPGMADKSELIARVTAVDSQKRMPPVASGKKLTQGQIELLRQWVASGAKYAEHWAYVKPTRPEVPKVSDKAWPRNAVDNFILARLDREHLKPSAPADRYTLIRRVSLDLTGLPATPEEADAFVNDTRAGAYERLVDDLLNRESFGEHWARMWLDLARYADSAGYADDPPRNIWAYRDYVIRSFNANKRFNQFTIEQIAGDLLPDPTDEDVVATAFHRNTMTNNEGGTDDEEFRNAAIVDRVNTTMAVWMGTSMACAQCHHHKYDPFSQKEYFQLFAILNNTEDADRSDETPLQKLYSTAQKEQLARARSELSNLDTLFKTGTPELQAAQDRWERNFPWNVVWQRTLGICAYPLTTPEADAQYADPSDSELKPLLRDSGQRSETERATLGEWFRRRACSELKPQQERHYALHQEIASVTPNTVPVMQELRGEKRRATHVQLRGNFLALGDTVQEAVPAVFHPLPKAEPPDRLALARWIVDESNPLTARVIVNRFWEQIFGIGIVRTSEDFGSQGDLPTDPELLDWLATEFMASGWDVKALLKFLVTSSTYCQSSKVTADLLEKDPDNLLLGRGPRFRLTAEEVRDQALCASGLLSHKMYGPPVRPPQPSLGLTAAFGGSLDWKTSDGEDRYRRALYVEWRRTNPYPSLQTFDAPNREVCALRRPRSNTPLQALVTLNDPVFVEAAQALGRRMALMRGTPADKVKYGFRLCLTRLPREREIKTLLDLYQKALAQFGEQPEQAEHMATEPIGPVPAGADAPSLAAWSVVGNVVLNLDELLMKP
ncbi:MAG TPA: PSD1 and planctomycete cytochrome C domain-containing protein [Candidatus Dormibacteraeota bacterium]|nr:PSD1 and planctomycete cytochrome C domain-containing protein [Candidatus Dormibacteraeota bacterium]